MVVVIKELKDDARRHRHATALCILVNGQNILLYGFNGFNPSIISFKYVRFITVDTFNSRATCELCLEFHSLLLFIIHGMTRVCNKS